MQGMAFNRKLYAELERQDPQLAAVYKRQEDALLAEEYPKPTEQAVNDAVDELCRDWDAWVEEAQKNEDVRYLKAKLDRKVTKDLVFGKIVHSRLSNNEVLRVAALILRNALDVKVPPVDDTAQAAERAEKIRAFAQAFWPAMEKAREEPLRRLAVDSQLSVGLGAWELFYTHSYEAVKDAVKEPKPDEDMRSYKSRRQRLLQAAGLPVGVRAVNAFSLKFSRDDEGVATAAILERKNYRKVHRTLRRQLGQDEMERLKLPKPGDKGWPMERRVYKRGRHWAADNDASGDVETVRYYDRHWYVYMVAGKIVECVPHGFGRVPVFPFECFTTHSSQNAERLQGVTWGMAELEQAIDLVHTKALDNLLRFGGPALYVATEFGAEVQVENGERVRVDLTDNTRAPQLNPGQIVKNAYEGIKPGESAEQVSGALVSFWQRSGLSPVSMGESPGADPAGYSLNTMIQSSNDLYVSPFENFARAAAAVIETTLYVVKHTIGLPMYMPIRERGSGATRVLRIRDISPEDIDEQEIQATVDPIGAQNRMAIMNMFRTGWQDRVVPKEVYQREAYEAEDPAIWDDLIIADTAFDRLVEVLGQEAMGELQRAAGAGGTFGVTPPGGGGPGQSVGPPAGAPGGGMQPPPTAGAAPNLPAAGALAGQNNGYQPPNAAG